MEAPGDLSRGRLETVGMVKGEVMVTLETVRMEAKWGADLETNFFLLSGFFQVLQSEGSKENTTGAKE